MKMRHLLIAAAFALATFLPASSARAQVDDEALTALVQVLSETDDDAFRLDVLRGMSDGLKGQRKVAMPAGWEALEGKLLASDNADVRNLTQSMSLLFGSSRAMDTLRAQVRDNGAPVEQRRAALQSLIAARDPKLPAVLKELLADGALRAAALRGMAAYEDPSLAEAILRVLPGLNTAEKRDALSSLAARAASARLLIGAVSGGQLPASDLTADVVRQLRMLKQEDIDTQVAKFWGVVRQSPEAKLEEMAKLKKLIETKVRRAPDANHGRALFARTCQQCHTLFGMGGKVGPDITGSNRGDLDYLLHNVVDPNAEIPNDYRTSTVDTKDDRVITGILTTQPGGAVKVVTQNETLLIPKSDISLITPSELSMMPEGLLANFKPDEIRDLVAYLRSPAQVPMLATPDTLDFFFNGEDLTGWTGAPELWSVEHGEIVGKTTGLKHNEWIVAPLLLSDFQITLEIKLVENQGNSGIQFRSKALPNGEVAGYQADVGQGWWGKLYEEHGRALLWDKSGEQHLKPGEWNQYVVKASGSKLETYINGKPCVNLDDPDGAKSGIIAFQLHAGGPTEVRYRNFKIELLN